MPMSDLNFLESSVQMPLMRLPVRSAVVSVGSSRILFSPGSKLTDEQLRSAGDVTDIVATNIFHAAGIPRAHSVFPKAKLWAVPGLKKAKPKIPWSLELGSSPWPFQEVLQVHHIKGMPSFNEFVFLHSPSKTLIVSDLCFNMLDETGVGPWLILGLFGTYRKFGVSKFFLSKVKNPNEFESSLNSLMTTDFDRIVLGHGQNIDGGGKALLQKAFKERGFLKI